LKDGMRIDQSIVDRSGRVLIRRGTLLDEFMISAMLKRGIGGVYIGDGEDDLVPDNNNSGTNPEQIVIPEKTKQIVAMNRVIDKKKVRLSESVKERVGEGIRFLYANTEDSNFTSATNNIADDLMKAILENDAIAVDVDALKVSDEYTFKHSVDVAAMAMVIGKRYGLSEKQVYELGIAGLLHDVGKSKIPNEVLNKPGRLTDEEFKIIKDHSLFGYNILKGKNDINDHIRLGVLQHHEKINGQGYPMAVPGDRICPYARILSIVDIYDALITERPYKAAFSKRDAVEMLMAMTDELDIDMMSAFLNSVILYPVDSIVSLSNGEMAKVVANSPGYPLRPKVVEIATGAVYDLAGDIKCASIVIA